MGGSAANIQQSGSIAQQIGAFVTALNQLTNAQGQKIGTNSRDGRRLIEQSIWYHCHRNWRRFGTARSQSCLCRDTGFLS